MITFIKWTEDFFFPFSFVDLSAFFFCYRRKENTHCYIFFVIVIVIVFILRAVFLKLFPSFLPSSFVKAFLFQCISHGKGCVCLYLLFIHENISLEWLEVFWSFLVIWKSGTLAECKFPSICNIISPVTYLSAGEKNPCSGENSISNIIWIFRMFKICWQVLSFESLVVSSFFSCIFVF